MGSVDLPTPVIDFLGDKYGTGHRCLADFQRHGIGESAGDNGIGVWRVR